jgi:alkylation response protein AidB-like acyl-CoA dehydrogenase
MDFRLDEQQSLMRDSAARFVAEHCAFERRRAVAAARGAGPAYWAAFAQMGWLGAGLAEAVGGYGGTAVDMALIAEQLGRGLVLEPFVDVAVFSAQMLQAFHGEPAAAAVLGALIEGRSVVIPAVLAEGAQLRQAAGGPRLSGVQTFVAGGAHAQRFIVAAREAGGLSLVLLEPGTPGLCRHDYRLIDGSPACDLRFDDIAVEAHQRLGPPGSAASVIAAAREQAVVAWCAQALGVMDLALTTTRDYLLQRRQFGVPLATFQVLRHRLADMLIAHEQARATLHGALAALSGPDEAARGRAVAIAKAQSGRSGRFVGAQAIQLHGGIGMTDEYVIGHCFKRLMVLDVLGGSASTHLASLAGSTAT